MSAARPLALLAVAVLLAGCSHPPAASGPGPTAPSLATASSTAPDRLSRGGAEGPHWANQTASTAFTGLDTPSAGFQVEGANGYVWYGPDVGVPGGTVLRVLGGNFTVAWDAQEPLLEELEVRLADGPQVLSTVTGPSPQTLALGPHELVQVLTFSVHPTQPASAQVRQPIDFSWSFRYEGDPDPPLRTCGCG